MFQNCESFSCKIAFVEIVGFLGLPPIISVCSQTISKVRGFSKLNSGSKNIEGTVSNNGSSMTEACKSSRLFANKLVTDATGDSVKGNVDFLDCNPSASSSLL
ncbi:unnamed protein product [Rhizophagus irregularis]|nr:unnamed protein product [Rhizophagus irregularis]